MTELRSKIDLDIQNYNAHITSSYGGSMLRYILASVIIIGLLIWLTYSLSDEPARKNFRTKFNDAISTIKDHLQPGSSKKREKPSKEDGSNTKEEDGSSEDGNYAVDRSVLLSNDTDTINAALNEPQSATISKSNSDFKNDYSDSTIQLFHRKHEIGWALSADHIEDGGYSLYSTT